MGCEFKREKIGEMQQKCSFISLNHSSDGAKMHLHIGCSGEMNIIRSRRSLKPFPKLNAGGKEGSLDNYLAQ